MSTCALPRAFLTWSLFCAEGPTTPQPNLGLFHCVGPSSFEVLLAGGVTFWVPTHAPQSLVTLLGVHLPFSRIIHVVLPWSWPSHGSYLYQGLPAVAWILHESGLPPTGTRTYGLEASFLCYCSELLRSKASSRCHPLHGVSYPWASGGNTIDISAWLRLLLAMSLPGDASLGRCLCSAMPLLGDVRPPNLPLANTLVTHKAATTDYVSRRTPLP